MNIQQYLNAFECVHGEFGISEKKMLLFSLENFVLSRNNRAHDLLSGEMRTVVEIEKELFSLGLPKAMLCVDGRVLAKLIASLQSGAIRTPAADNAEFLPNAEGESLFLSEGKLARDIRGMFSGANEVVWIVDSHLHCAARKAISTDMRGATPADDGLFDDIVRKKKIACALQNFVRKEFGSAKRIILIHTSFNPHSGYIFSGLERDEVMTDGRVLREGFTESVLSELVEEGKILSTEHWAREDGALYPLFSKYVFDLDYEISYRTSTLRFWENLKEISRESVSSIEKELLAISPDLHDDAKALRERAVLFLANAYNAFLLNRCKGGYPYGNHDESVIVVTSGDRGPYDRMRSFSVDPHNPNLSFVIKFVEGLVRNNRLSGRTSVVEREAIRKFFGERSEEYVRSVVPVFFFQKLEQDLPLDMMEKIENIDWSDVLSLQWMNATDTEFRTYLEEKLPNFPECVAEKIERLREEARRVFCPGLAATDDLLSGRLFPVFALRSFSHEIIALLPFLVKGYREEK